jgi:acyl-CoA synthetase (AMP-forming)/AMP-acid ligase II
MENNRQSMNFFLYDFKKLYKGLHESKKKKLLFGVSFALLDFAEEYSVNLKDLTIIETGGMKGRKKELTKSELYRKFQNSFINSSIISEYGMTELLSQAYSDKNCIYTCPPWMKILSRADNDPLSKGIVKGHTAALNIIDLANINSCCFIATDDLGKVYEDGRFEVTGRLDQSDIRGCSLMAI